MSRMPPKVLVCDPIADEGVRALQEFGAEVDVRLRQSPEELIANIPEYEAVVVRSETKITAAADRKMIPFENAKRWPRFDSCFGKNPSVATKLQRIGKAEYVVLAPVKRINVVAN